ncbi:ankyrin repeat-containing domain, PGG domain protein [Tanacetum coccineum]
MASTLTSNPCFLCVEHGHDMLGFINGQFLNPSRGNGKAKVGDMKGWYKSDSLVKGWILGSLSEEVATSVVNSPKGGTISTQFAKLRVNSIPEDAKSKDHNQRVKAAIEERTRLYEFILLGKVELVNDFLGIESHLLLEKMTNNGNAALHVAVGSSTKYYQFLKKLLEKIPAENTLWDVRNSDGSTLLHVAAIVGNTKAANILLKRNPDLLLAEDKEGHTPLAISLYNLFKHVKSDREGYSIFWRNCSPFQNALEDFEYESTVWKRFISAAIRMILAASNFIVRVIVWSFVKERIRIHESAIRLLASACNKIRLYTHSSTYHHYYTNPIFEATKQNASEVVTKIVSHFQDAIWSTHEDGHNFVQYAVIHHSSGNNLLHLAARLAPANKFNLKSGAALQIQRELQWFQEVEGFVCPLHCIQKNSEDETLEIVFMREHKDLVIQGEKWIKSTAESYTITAALITTVVFAAAITVPGNYQNTGIPIFTNKNAFIIFAVSDAVSLFTAVTSLLVFLSILTARFAEQDFLIKLPRRLMIGLTALFISTTTMNHDHSFCCNIVSCVWKRELVDAYSNRCIDMPANYFFCDLAVSSYRRLD